jgi:hypothetical protein
MSGEPNDPVGLDLLRRFVDGGARPLRWLLDRGRARRLRRARLAPVRMIDRAVLLRLSTSLQTSRGAR